MCAHKKLVTCSVNEKEFEELSCRKVMVVAVDKNLLWYFVHLFSCTYVRRAKEKWCRIPQTYTSEKSLAKKLKQRRVKNL